MAQRLNKIVTKTGDDGSTGLGDGSRVLKNHLRIEALGTIDELNSLLGMLLASATLAEEIRVLLTQLQHHLFELGAELAVPGSIRIKKTDISILEQYIQHYNAKLAPLKEFILPGGSGDSALCHFIRAVCRRAERCVVGLQQHEPGNRNSLIYLNRLSDLLFILARIILKHDGGSELLWQARPEFR